jgi:glycosyltransferase A (GT-A) superfamily protein (DUF2064 family)
VTRALVVAKAPVAGEVKTRLGADVGMAPAAALAAAALLDTMAACAAAYGPRRCHLALAGDLAAAVDGDRVRDGLACWAVAPQRGPDLAARLVNAHLDVGRGPVVQVGMDTPQLTPALLDEAADGLGEHDAVVGPAEDGGWWVLALRDPEHARVLAGVPMSTPSTYGETRAALAGLGLRVGTAALLRDVDTVADAEAVARLAPGTRFARQWARLS